MKLTTVTLAHRRNRRPLLFPVFVCVCLCPCQFVTHTSYEQLSPYRNLSPTHPNMMSLAAPMRLPGGPRIPLRAPIPRDYGKSHSDFYE